MQYQKTKYLKSVDIFFTKAFLSKIFEGEIIIRILPTTLLQIFCENLLYFQVIFKSMKIADDTFLGKCKWVNKCPDSRARSFQLIPCFVQGPVHGHLLQVHVGYDALNVGHLAVSGRGGTRLHLRERETARKQPSDTELTLLIKHLHHFHHTQFL